MSNIKKIIITGPESTGKSTICKQLAEQFNTVCIDEFARTYVENLNRKYNYSDLVNIARKQIEQLTNNYKHANRFVFFDTGLIITKIWFDIVFGNVPEFVETALQNIKIDMYLLCKPDIDWVWDKVRENSGEERKRLFKLYENELIRLNQNYKITEGKGTDRFQNALENIASAHSLHKDIMNHKINR